MTLKESRIVLLSITLCWAASYIFIKDVPADLSTYAYLALTSGVAGIILGGLFFRKLRLINRRVLIYSLILGVLIMGNMIFEKKALDILPASMVSTFASLNIVIVPLILILRRNFPSRNNIAGIAIILLGIFISRGFSLQGGNFTGVIYVISSCVMMSLYTVFAAEFTKKCDPLLLTVLQLCITAGIGLVLWVVTEPDPFGNLHWTYEMVSYILIIAFYSKAYAYVMLMYGEKYSDAISVTVIAATEPIVTLFLALIIPSVEGNTELFSPQSLGSAMIIAVGAIVAGTNFLSRSKAVSAEEQTGPLPTVPLPEKGPESAGAQNDSLKGSARGRSDLKERYENMYRGYPAVSIFLLILIVFAVQGSSINLFEFAEGYSEIRPENSIPIVAGLLFGPIGALACAFGNLLGDALWIIEYNVTTILGMLGNFLSAYIAYLTWRAFSKEAPNVHSWKNLALFVYAVCFSNLVCVWILDIGLEMLSGTWYDNFMTFAWGNNIFFSLAIGLPLFIVLTSEKTWPYRGSLTGKTFTLTQRLILVESGLLLVMYGCNRGGMHWGNSVIVKALSVVCAGVLVLACVGLGQGDVSG